MWIRLSYALCGIATGSLILGYMGYSPLVSTFALLSLLGLAYIGASEWLRATRSSPQTPKS